MNREKPVVLYEAVVWEPVVGNGALLQNVKHYREDVRGALVQTSTVVRVGEDGEFETLNTIYRKKEKQ